MKPIQLNIHQDVDIITAREKGRRLAQELGFGLADQTRLATAISELVRNVVQYAGRGIITLKSIITDSKRGLEVVVADQGPGIEDVEQAMRDGYSTSGGLGMGLPGARRLAHEFDIVSQLGRGTTVTIRMWLR
jgi:serine/threonine-protein kinase RsbT